MGFVKAVVTTGLPAALLAALLAGCGAWPAAAPSQEQPVRVAFATAPGEILAFVPAEASVATTGSVIVILENRSSVEHNLVFAEPLEAATRTIVDPGDSDQVLLEGLTPGSHAFLCTIHEGMRGVLVVQHPAP